MARSNPPLSAVLLAGAVFFALGSWAQARPAAEPASQSSAAGSATTPGPAAVSQPSASPGALSQRLVQAGFSVPKAALSSVDFELPSLSGGTTKLSSLRGSVVMLNFWATWCPPCRSEMPSMEKLYEELKGEGFVILAVDLQESREQVSKFVAENHLTFPVLLDSSGQVGVTYGAQSIPTTWIIDRSGGIVARTIGGREWNTPEMLSIFRALLAKP